MGKIWDILLRLGTVLGCNFFCYDYSGYGQSTGRPSEKNVKDDIGAVFHCLITEFGIRPDEVILHGRSIGSLPTVSLASEVDNIAGVILEGSFLSAMKILLPRRECFFDAFRNVDKITKMKVPTLVIHAVDDEVVPFCNGKKILELCQNPVEPLWVDGGHNKYTNESNEKYKDRLKYFIHQELPNQKF